MNFDHLVDHDTYMLTVEGIRIQAQSGVFAPNAQLTCSTQLVLQHLPDLGNKTVLDVGTGTGILAVACAQKGARVHAVDISSQAVENARYNAQLHGLNIDVYQSDLFEHVEDSYDCILANLPIYYTDYKDNSVQLLERFLQSAKNYLNKDAVMYVPWFNIVPTRHVRKLLDTYNYSFTEVQHEYLGYMWSLFTITC